MNKDELREQALLHLEKIRPEDEDCEGTSALFQQHVDVKPGQIVAAYWPMGSEFDVRYIIDDLITKGVPVALPISNRSKKEMVFSKWDGKGDLIKGTYGVFIPPKEELVEPDILLVPLLAFDRKGYRLGRGAGHYDATLAALRAQKHIIAIGVGYASQAVLFNLPVEDHDQKMDMIITPNGVMDFRN